jgi:hypothetical protein
VTALRIALAVVAAVPLALWVVALCRGTPLAVAAAAFGPWLVAMSGANAAINWASHQWVLAVLWTAAMVVWALEWWSRRPPRPPRRVVRAVRAGAEP